MLIWGIIFLAAGVFGYSSAQLMAGRILADGELEAAGNQVVPAPLVRSPAARAYELALSLPATTHNSSLRKTAPIYLLVLAGRLLILIGAALIVLSLMPW